MKRRYMISLMGIFLGLCTLLILLHRIPLRDALSFVLYVPLVILIPGCVLTAALTRTLTLRPATFLATGYVLGMLFAGAASIFASTPYGWGAEYYVFAPYALLPLGRVRDAFGGLATTGIRRILETRLSILALFGVVFLAILSLLLLFYNTPGIPVADIDFHVLAQSSYLGSALRGVPANRLSLSGWQMPLHYNLWGHLVGAHFVRITGVSALSFVSNGAYISFLPVVGGFWVLLFHTLGMRGWRLAYSVLLLCVVDCPMFRMYELRLYFPNFLGMPLLLASLLLSLDDQQGRLTWVVRWIVTPFVLTGVSLPGGIILLGGHLVCLVRRLYERRPAFILNASVMCISSFVTYVMFFKWEGSGVVDVGVSAYYGTTKPYQLFAFARGYSAACAQFQDAWLVGSHWPALAWQLSGVLSGFYVIGLHILFVFPAVAFVSLLTKRVHPLPEAVWMAGAYAIVGYASFSVIDLAGVSQAHMVYYGASFLLAWLCIRWGTGEYAPWVVSTRSRRLLLACIHVSLVIPLLLPPLFYTTHGISRRYRLGKVFSDGPYEVGGRCPETSEILPYLPHDARLSQELHEACSFIRLNTPQSTVIVSPGLVFPREIENRWIGCGRSYMISALTERYTYFESTYEILPNREEMLRRLRALHAVLEGDGLAPEIMGSNHVYLLKRPTYERLSRYEWDVLFENSTWIVASPPDAP